MRQPEKFMKPELKLSWTPLNNHIAAHSTMPDDITEWAKNQWNEAGGSGTPPGLVDDKLSEAGLYKLLFPNAHGQSKLVHPR